MSQYADDTSLFLEATEKSLRTALNLITYYAKFSGLSMNNDKTRVIWLGSMKNSCQKFCENFNLNWDQGHFTVLGVIFSTDLKEIIKINYDKKLRDIKNLLLQWSRRSLTPYGKNIVIKTLAMSKINHLLLSLPSPPEIVLKNLQSVFYKFLWNNSRDRIKRKVSCKDYCEGGLRVIDIHVFNQSLKITWIRRLFSSENTKWSNLLQTQWPEYRNFTIFGIDLIKRNLAKLNEFWRDVFQALIILENNTGKFRSNLVEFLNEPIWYNPHILINRKSVFIKHIFDSGVRTINDLVNTDGMFLSLDDFCNTFSININFLEYNALLRAIRQFRISRYNGIPVLDRKLETPTIPNLVRIITKDSKGCRFIYEHLIKNNQIPTSRRKWENNYGFGGNYEWKKVFDIPYKTTLSTRTRWFQFRLLHRILATNIFLQKNGFVDSDRCSFCNNASETLSHLFWSCDIVKDFFK